MENLYEKLVQYQKGNYYPMHMPGHKRRSDLINLVNAYQIDITEIEGFDNLHEPQGVLKEAQEKAKRLYNSSETHLLINGSTVGLLGAISACTKKKEKVLVARNCHKAVYDAIYINDLEPVYIYPCRLPEYEINGGICPKDIEKKLNIHKDIKLVIITSPTYEGIVSDISAIAEVTKRFGAILLIDEAHGAHFGFCHEFPKNSLTMGADIVIHSMHKTLPSLTQTALLHINYSVGDKLKNEIKRYLTIYQTSSPSYVLMSSIDLCIDVLENKGKLFEDYIKRLNIFIEKIKKLEFIEILNSSLIGNYEIYNFDLSKLVIFIKDRRINGNELYKTLLEKYHIQMEMVSENYVLGMTSIFDTDEGFERLWRALSDIDKYISEKIPQKTKKAKILWGSNYSVEMAMTPSQAYDKENIEIELINSEGKISAEYVYLYPPGIPLIVPGEIISQMIIDNIQSYIKAGLSVKGLKGKDLKKVSIVLC